MSKNVDMSVFSREYVPEHLKVRQKEARAILDEGHYPKIVFGAPALGKTTTAVFVARSNKERFDYVDCQASLRETLVPLVGHLASTGFRALKEYIEMNDGKTLMLDSVQKLRNWRPAEFDFSLLNLFDTYPRDRFILITNQVPSKFESWMKDDTKSRYRTADHILFSDYSTEEILAILEQRCELGHLKYDPFALKFLAEQRGTYDLRDLLTVLEDAAMKGEKLTDEFAKTRLDFSDSQRLVEDFAALQVTESMVLGAVALTQVRGFADDYAGSRGNATSVGNVYRTLTGILTLSGRRIIGQEALRKAIKALVRGGLLDAEIDQYKRGRPLMLKCALSPTKEAVAFRKWFENSYRMKLELPEIHDGEEPILA